MKSEFLVAFNQICSERGLPPDVVLDVLRTALASAYRRNANISSAQNVTVEIDPNNGEAAIFVEKEAVDEVRNDDTEVQFEVARRIDPSVELNDTVMVESTPKDFGRIAAQTAKQVILQRIREAERDALYEDYIGREGEIINGVVQSITPHSISLNLGRTEAILPRKEQVPGERYMLHQRLRAYVVEVKRSGRGPQIIVSRSHKSMLRRLLELEVPEIYNGAVEINAIAREAGARSKVAVSARQAGVDPVGSCVGMRGVRIQSIVNELGGEKIDVIEWNPEPPVFIAKALSPARVLAVHLVEDEESGRTATVVVPDDQLSLAIGREGQNARLAAKLTGWRIDIKSVTEAAREALAQASDEHVQAELGTVSNLLPSVAALLEHRPESHIAYTTEQLLLLRQVIDSVHNYFAAKRFAERKALLDHEAARRAVLSDEEVQLLARREQARAQVPEAAYGIPLGEVGLSTRVFNHLDRAKLENLGQIMERLVSGDEGLLALDGIGPKALAEIKGRIEEVAPAAPEELEAEAPEELEPESTLEVEPELQPEEMLMVAQEIVDQAAMAEEAPGEVEPVVEMPKVAQDEPAVEPEPAEVPPAEPEVDEAQRRAEIEEALARIPADAYDIPLAVLALSGKVAKHLRAAKIDNLGRIMERLAEGDEELLAAVGMDTGALDEIKAQVEIMVSIPSVELEREAQIEEKPKEERLPRYEYVADDEFEEKTQIRRRRKKRKAQLVYDEDANDILQRPRQKDSRLDDWDEFEE